MEKNTTTSIAYVLLNELNINVTIAALKDALETHPNFPNLISLNDVLNSYGVDTQALKSTWDDLLKIQYLPIVVQLKNIDFYGTHYFTVVKKVMDDSVELYDEDKKSWVKISRSYFLEKWTGNVLLAVASKDAQGEKDYDKNIKKEKRNDILAAIALSALPLITITLSIVTIFRNGRLGFITASFNLLFFTGEHCEQFVDLANG